MKVELDGVILETQAGAAWAEVAGTAPFQLGLEVDARVGRTIFDAGRRHGSTMTVTTTQNTETYRGLTVLGLASTSNPWTVELIVVDRRWELAYKHVKRSYNVRRKTGNVRRVENDAAPTEVGDVEPDVAYAAWSLKGGTKTWAPEEILTDVMDLIAGVAGWTDRDVIGQVKLPDIEGLELDSAADGALGRLLAELGGAVGIYVDKAGRYVVYNRLDDGERQLVKSAARTIDGPDMFVGPSVWIRQDRRKERPSAYRILFTREIELRIDNEEQAPKAGRTKERGSPPAKSVNVLPLPFDAKLRGVQLIQGQWVELDDYLAIIGSPPFFPHPRKLPKLSLSLIRRAWLTSALEIYSNPVLDPSGLWALVMAPIRQHYRATYRVRKPWVDRIRGLRAYRVAIEQFETGARAPAPVYTDYAVRQTWRALGVEISKQPLKRESWQNRFANSGVQANQRGGPIVGTPLERLKQSPARVSIVDEEQGIFSVGFVLDFQGLATEITRSAVDKDGPTDDKTAKRQWRQEAQLQAQHEVSVLLTTTLSSPNDNRQLHVVEISAKDAEGQLPGAPSTPALGPVMEIRIPQTLSAARFAWQDSRAQAFHKAFDVAIGAERDQDIRDALGKPINEPELLAVAKAHAAREAGRFRNHIEGQLNTDWSPGLTIRGTVQKITHTFDDNNGAQTTVDFPSEPPRLEIGAILPASINRMVNRFVDR